MLGVLTQSTHTVTQSPLAVEVSCFKNYYTSSDPRSVDMLSWLNSGKYSDQVKAIRTTEDKETRNKIKATLPGITPSGLFRYRNGDPANFIKHSGLIQFDIDMKGNEHIGNYADLKKEICNISNVAYCGLSVSGRGYWGLVPIRYTEEHTAHFWGLYEAFKNLGMNLDTKPKDHCSLRGYSYDPDGYFNHQAKVFCILGADPASTVSSSKTKPFRRQHLGNNIRGEVEQLIQIIQDQRIDITAGIDNWLRLAYGLAGEFGEAGRDYFHAISQYHLEYDEKRTNDLFNSCLRGNSGSRPATLNTFFWLAKQHGIILRDHRPPSNASPYGINPWTGEVFDQRGYPADWDNVTLSEPGTVPMQQ